MACRRERREFYRRDCLMRCRCTGTGFRFDGYIVDISFGGAGIVAKQLPTPSAELLLNMYLPSESIEFPSRTAWTRAKNKKNGLADFGVEFLGSLPERKIKLGRFFPQSNTVEG